VSNISFQHLVNCKKSIERRTPNAQLTSTWLPPRSISRGTNRRTDSDGQPENTCWDTV